jgi:hypothetical protein
MTKYAGRQLTISIGSDSSESDETLIGQVVTLGNAGSSRNLIDASAYGDDWTDWVVGQQDGSVIAMEIAYDPNDEGGQAALVAAYAGGEPTDFEMEHADSGFRIGFPALVTKVERGAARDGLLVLDAELKILNPGVEDIGAS